VKGFSYTQDTYTAENTPAQFYGELTAQGCGRIAEFLAQYPWTEPRHGLLLTQSGKDQHLLLHNYTCSHLTMMLETLLPANLSTAERNTLDLLCKISKQSMLQTWPGDRLRQEVTTLGFEGTLSEIAELETRRFGFLTTIKETLLEVHDTLSNPQGTAKATHIPRLTHFLDMKPALTWIQFVLPEDLTHSPLQLTALHETFGLLGEITEIFLFKSRPECFIIFYGNLHIPNIDGIMAPQHIWIEIHNPQHSSAPICSSTAPHYPTQRPDIGTSVTLVGEQHEAIVVATEQNYWPDEWIYVIWIEVKGKPPKLLYTILDRSSLNSEDTPYRIRPTTMLLAKGDVAFFFDKFEKQTQVNVIQQLSPGLYETVRMVQTFLAQLSPRMIVQDIAGHRLFKLNELSFDIGRHSDQTRHGPIQRPDSTPMPEIICDQTLTVADPVVVFTGTVTIQDSQELSPPSNHTPLLVIDPSEALRSKRGWTTPEAEQNPLYGEDCTVVIPKKRRIRGASIPKILVRWRNYTISCIYSDRLTPAMLIEAISQSQRTLHDNFAKAILIPPNNLLDTLHLHLTLHTQGIGAGDTVTLVTRHARVHDPYGVQHFVAYWDEDIVQYFLSALPDISPIPLLSELVVCQASPWNPPGDSKIAIFPRSLPSTCALGANRVPILFKNL